MDTTHPTASTTADEMRYAHLMVQLAERSIDPWQDPPGVWHAKLTTNNAANSVIRGRISPRCSRSWSRDLRAAARQFGAIMDMPVTEEER